MFNKFKNDISKVDYELFSVIQKENLRQENHIELIASENYVSTAVMQAQGSQLTNKYAEGYPGKRYYGGCEYVDVVENLAIDRAKKLFNAEVVNVQPHSGSQANQAIFLAVLKPGETIMGMCLEHGGHLTHGSSVNISGKWFKVVNYGLNKDENIDYEGAEKTAIKHKPKLIIAGASAFSLHINFERIAYIAKMVGAYFMVDISHYAGLIAVGIYPNPIPYADFITTTTHKSLCGPRGGIILSKIQHKNKINSSIFPGIQGGPLMHVIAAKAIALKQALLPEFKIYQKQVLNNAQKISEQLITRGFRIVSGGTQSHLMLVDLRSKNINGITAENILEKVNITVNKNMIPNDCETPFITSGIRIGSLAITTRGFGTKESKQVANLIADALEFPYDKDNLNNVRKNVRLLTQQFPVYLK